MKLFRIGYINYASVPIAFVMLQRSGIFTFTLVGYFFYPKQRCWDLITCSRQHSKVIVSHFAKTHIFLSFLFFFLFFNLLVVRLQKFKYA